MKDRILNNWLTTILGLFIWVITLGLFVVEKFNLMEGVHQLGLLEIVSLLLLGWVFVASKTSLLNGLTLGLFKKLGWIEAE